MPISIHREQRSIHLCLNCKVEADSSESDCPTSARVYSVETHHRLEQKNMKRFSLILALCGLWVIPTAMFAQTSTTGTVRSIGASEAQFDLVIPIDKSAQVTTTGTIRGNIVDTSEAQLPIEGVRVVAVSIRGSEYEATTDSNGDYVMIGLTPNRYLLSIYKAGYVDRTGKPVTVVAGGDHYVPLKMTKRAGLMSLLERQFNSALWPFLLCVGSAFVLGYFIGRAGRRTDH